MNIQIERNCRARLYHGTSSQDENSRGENALKHISTEQRPQTWSDLYIAPRYLNREKFLDSKTSSPALYTQTDYQLGLKEGKRRFHIHKLSKSQFTIFCLN